MKIGKNKILRKITTESFIKDKPGQNARGHL